MILVTGASGFIGGTLAHRLVKDGEPVRCLVRATSDRARLDRLGVEIVVGDLDNAPSLEQAVAGCRQVCHCAALVSDWGTTTEIKRVNVGGTRALLEASLRASVGRFVHISTTDVYGHPGGEAIDERSTATRFSDWYGQTKLDGEAEVRLAQASGAIETVVLRPATVYGPGSTAAIGEIARALRNGTMFLIDRGRVIAGLVYVENLVDAVMLALRHDAAPGEAFNVTDGLAITWRRFTDDLAAGLGCSPARWSMPYWLAESIGFALEQGYRALRRTTGVRTAPLLSRQAVHVLGRDQSFSNHKARELLGWEPRVGYEAGLRATVDWLTGEYLAR